MIKKKMKDNLEKIVRTCPCEYRSLEENEDSRIVEGYALVFNSESEDMGFIEVIDRSSITQELVNNCDVFAKFNHDDDKILARSRNGVGSLQLTVDERGLKYHFEAPNNELGNSLLEYLKRGDINQSSFAFAISDEPDAQEWRKEGGKVYRTIRKIAYIFDVSPVWTPAYTATSCSKREMDYMNELDVKEKLDEKLTGMMDEIKQYEI